MPTKQEQFDALIASILNGSFHGNAIELPGFGLSDDYVDELMGAINNSKFKKIIKVIDLSNNWLTVPPAVEQCSALNFLYLHHNPFTIPPNITRCRKLEAIGLNNNSLSEVGKIALDLQRRRGLIVGGITPGALKKVLTKDLLHQHVIGFVDEYLSKEDKVLMDASVSDKILSLMHKHLSILLRILEDSKAHSSQISLVSSLFSQDSDIMTVIHDNCPALLYRDAVLAEGVDAIKANKLYLKAARLGNTKSLNKIEGYLRVNQLEYFDIIKCNIILDIMLNPVTTPSGQSYEAKAITSWVETTNAFLDPIRQPLDIPAGSGNISLVPNHTLEKLIDYMIEVNTDISNFPGFFDPKTSMMYVDPYVTLNGETVEKNDEDHSLRRDLVLKELIKYVQHKSIVTYKKPKLLMS